MQSLHGSGETRRYSKDGKGTTNLVAIHPGIEGIIIAFKNDEVCPHAQAATEGYVETRLNASLDCLTTVVLQA